MGLGSVICPIVENHSGSAAGRQEALRNLWHRIGGRGQQQGIALVAVRTGIVESGGSKMVADTNDDGTMVILREALRWVSTETDQLTDEYWELHGDKVIDEAYRAQQEAWKARQGKRAKAEAPCQICGEPRGKLSPCPHCGMD